MDAALGEVLLELGELRVGEHAAATVLAEALGDQLDLERATPPEVRAPCAQAALEHLREARVARRVVAPGADQPAELEQQGGELRRGPEAHRGLRGHESPIAVA